MDVREKLVELIASKECDYYSGVYETWIEHDCEKCGVENCSVAQLADHLISHGVTVQENCKSCAEATQNCIVKLQEQIAELRSAQEWISVKGRTPTEADGTVWVCLADVFPYNEKEPYIDAKHDRRITEAHYSQFNKCWYKEGAVLPDGIVTHWMEKPQPPKGE